MDEEEIPYLKSIVKGAGLVLLGTILSKIILYLYRIYVARVFGPSGYGLFAIGVGLITLISTFALLGLSNGITRYLSIHKNDKRKVKGIISFSIKIVALISFLLSIVLYVFSNDISILVFHSEELTGFVRILAFSIPFISLSMVMYSCFRGFQKIKYEIYSSSIFDNLIKLIFVVLIGFLGFGVYSIPWSWTMASMVTFLLAFYFLQKKTFNLIRNPISSFSIKKELVVFSLPVLMSSTLALFLGWINVMVLGFYSSTESVGFFDAALTTSKFMYIVPNSFVLIFLPVLSSLHAKKMFKDMKTVYQHVAKWNFYLCFPLALIMLLLSKQIINMLFGYEYVVAGLALSVLSIGILVESISWMSRNVLLSLGKTKFEVYNLIIICFINFVLSLMLIPEYGIYGAALSTTISYVFWGVINNLGVYHYLKTQQFTNYYLKSIFSATIALIIIYVLVDTIAEKNVFLLSAMFIIYIIVYLIILVVLRGFNETDLLIISSIENKFGLKLDFLKRVIRKWNRR
jgi:O-antigen/teichoic acid export membrane protein